MKRLKGELSIGRVSCSGGDDYINIRLKDELSGCCVVEIKVPLIEWANITTGMSHRNVEFEYFDHSKIGMRLESKKVFVPCKQYRPTDAQMDAVLAPFEIDGWEGSRCDMYNHHNRVSNSGYHVRFRRLVQADSGQGESK